MRNLARGLLLLLFIACASPGKTQAQATSELKTTAETTATATTIAPAATAKLSPIPNDYSLRRGMNEFSVWGGGAFAATTAFGGLHADEASDRKFVIAAFRYGRVLAANKSLSLEYTVDAIPLAVAVGNIVTTSTTPATVPTLTTTRRESVYGAGLTPLGFHLDFAQRQRVKPFVELNGGFLIFRKPVPLPDSGRFSFIGETGGGVRIFTSARRAVTLGVKFHHISNGNISGSNRGLNQFVFYTGFSIFK